MYQKYINSLWIKLCIAIGFTLLVAGASYHYRVHLPVIGLLFIFWFFIFVKSFLQKNRRIKQISEILTLGEKSYDTNLFQCKDEEKWIKGVLFYNGYIFPTWIAVDNIGITIVICLRTKGNTVLIPWGFVTSVKNESLKIDKKIGLYNYLHLQNQNCEFVIPWSQECNIYIPESVGELK
jgi:hypothetical protein